MLAPTHFTYVNTDPNAHARTGMESGNAEHKFGLLSGLFAALDSEVHKSGFFKYQHIGTQYIVACPRAAAPFGSADEDPICGRNSPCGQGGAAEEGYPAGHLTGMVALGLKMLAVTDEYFGRAPSLGAEASLVDAGAAAASGRSKVAGDAAAAMPYFLRVAIAHGEAAGAVVGCMRPFYCIYGDTINTAARLCMCSTRGTIHASAAVMAMLKRGRPGPHKPCQHSFGAFSILDLDMVPRGRIQVKGKGEMVTFDIRGWAGLHRS